MNRIMTYRPRGSEVEAIQVTPQNVRSIAQWCGGRIIEEATDQKKDVSIVVPTLEGNMRAREGDWVAKNTDGSFVQFNSAYFDSEYVRA